MAKKIRRKKKILKSVLKMREKRANKRQLNIDIDKWKSDVKIRDGFTCQLCNKTILDNKSMHVHHIVPNVFNYKNLKSDIQNGILLCPYCHKWAPYSPHMNSILFAEWLKINRTEIYYYLLGKMGATEFNMGKVHEPVIEQLSPGSYDEVVKT